MSDDKKTWHLIQPDYDFVVKHGHWTIGEAVRYLVTYKLRDNRYLNKEEVDAAYGKSYSDHVELVKRYINSNDISLNKVYYVEDSDEIALEYGPYNALSVEQSKVKPLDFIIWSNQLGLPLPEEFKVKLPDYNKGDAALFNDVPLNISDEKLDRLLCQAIAKTLWFIYPKMTIEEVKLQNPEYNGHPIRN